jgi:glycosyltransferase involved in cell wall biosynthesis
MTKIAWLSDFDLKGSGYLNLSVPLCNGLAKKGYEIKASGLGYKGTEHYHDVAIIPAGNLQDALAIIQNLYHLWEFEVLVVALDIPLQERFLAKMQDRPFKYVGIMPIEADPLCMSWAMALMAMDKALIISEFGTEEARKVGIDAEHIQLGIDTKSWRMPIPEEREQIRKSLLGFDEDIFAVLTVADNQERKHLSRSMEIFADFAKDKPNTRYVMVTREHNIVGWRLRDYAQELGINNKLMIFERGMDFKQLWSIYAGCDTFLLTSKAEGLGLPLLEAMAVGLPCIATDCTGMAELLANNRGFLIETDYVHRDPFGNGRRYFANAERGVEYLNSVFSLSKGWMETEARNYVEKRKWQIAVDHLDNVITGLLEE